MENIKHKIKNIILEDNDLSIDIDGHSEYGLGRMVKRLMSRRSLTRFNSERELLKFFKANSISHLVATEQFEKLFKGGEGLPDFIFFDKEDDGKVLLSCYFQDINKVQTFGKNLRETSIEEVVSVS